MSGGQGDQGPSEKKSRRDFAAVLVALGARPSGSPWFQAEEIRGLLKKRLSLDFTTQQVASWLTRMTREDLPRFQRRSQWGGPWEYAVTAYGKTEVENAMPNLRATSWTEPSSQDREKEE